MDDRELLELAAKAADYISAGLFWDKRLNKMWDGEGFTWDPLNDEGDALRLATKLGICISFIPECDTVQVFQRNEYAEIRNVHTEAMDDFGVCRAIVQAAAEIGRSIQAAQQDPAD